MSRTQLGRADLVRLVASDARMRRRLAEAARKRTSLSEELRFLSDLVGLEWNPPEPKLVLPPRESATGDEPSLQSTGVESEPPKEGPVQSEPPRFWRVVSYRALAPLRLPEEAMTPKGIWQSTPGPAASSQPLCPWPVLVARVRGRLETSTFGCSIDVKKVVNDFALGRTLGRLPGKPVRSWGDRVVLVIDRSTRLIPYSSDQRFVEERLSRLLGESKVEVLVTTNPLAGLRRAGSGPSSIAAPPSLDGCLVIVVGDLGVLERSTTRLREAWWKWGVARRERGCRLLAAAPCAETAIPAPLRSVYRIVPFQRWRNAHEHSPEARRKAIDTLLTWLAPAMRVEPGLLRDVRLKAGLADASLEAEFWQCDAVASPHPVAATLATDAVARSYLPGFDELDEADRVAALRLIARWHASLPSEVWLTEIARLSSKSEGSLDESERRRRDDFLLHMAAEGAGKTRYATALRSYSRCVDSSVPESAGVRGPHALGRTLHNYFETISNKGGDPPPPGEASFCCVDQVGDNVQLRRDGKATPDSEPQTGIPLCRIAVGNGRVSIEPDHAYDRNSFWKSGRPPHWARTWGWDQYGAWATIRFEKEGFATVDQKLRWIPPGEFPMGSPDNEEGRWDDEGPQHRVTISQGFWLFDTPVTQACWQLVMGENPSQFKGAGRPVEQVSYQDCQAFLGRLAEGPFMLEMELPTEAQWEYVCRAGTTTRYSFGDEISESLARYGVGDGTVDVKSYPPNPLGLFDMHGNVYEWCRDGQRKYSKKPQVDPVGPIDEMWSRVVRGGSWDYLAPYVRSAFRFAFEPALRDSSIGFRCALVQDGAEPAARDSGRRAEPKANPKPAGEAQEISLAGDAVAEEPLPDAPRVVVRSDVDELTIEQMVRPSWALAVGRDQYGLWADFEIYSLAGERKATKRKSSVEDGDSQPTSSGKSIRQRVRWIPPGRFQMGSPKSEEGRFDNEDPQHEVILTKGFWLFDVPCRQSLYAALQLETPSYFKDSERPVEQVTFQNAQEFCRKLKGAFEVRHGLTSLSVRLPSEAEWEYACRAGSTTAIYTGELKIIGENNAPALDSIAWYGGNSGKDFDLEKGVGSKDWPNKQYPHTEAGTRRVGQKAPNSWGLYDMLGNVWEWCFDGKRQYSDKVAIDPLGPTDVGASRVVRGGSWFNCAQYVRSAYRFAGGPADRNDVIGFRCALVQDVGEAGRAGSGAERTEPVSGRDATKRRARSKKGK